ncbi:hypothetical protein [Chromatium okenii]|jgi:uncharacterized membrane protein YuzA (DUF378 family)|nr:hypothetical protein [Chromatium okenii]
MKPPITLDRTTIRNKNAVIHSQINTLLVALVCYPLIALIFGGAL